MLCPSYQSRSLNGVKGSLAAPVLCPSYQSRSLAAREVCRTMDTALRGFRGFEFGDAVSCVEPDMGSLGSTVWFCSSSGERYSSVSRNGRNAYLSPLLCGSESPRCFF